MVSDRQTAQGLCAAPCGDYDTSGMCRTRREQLGLSTLPTKLWLTTRINQLQLNLSTVKETIDMLESDLGKAEADFEAGRYRI